ncbi:class I SAM-dependent methyltransferase [Commensalibacter papalotli (ex Botero et al. 2024)]|uniref:Ubiquinone/menaquinone biosynthesis C-methylase UbiE/MenG (UbiE) (PDB:4OBW) n=1 Tax=Commensalibacter papalotli (ex Botero et al. 2024) TaxID=2972766 RepID=A0ABM9HTR2_9PROT|nr:methyltransferase domain-containing protein [Commensalibacter papalotli (ex Botero et al. 2024)]CAI3955982.1 Ubiquinone/menaquinone biosynthesis C-methylase UbiE/MenG (UbiE) (PDB:4OBW) [Commensalibacter papalotli (ex Botero et al. 2024)]CAI3956153.1 Ubiquinone/menaquinone biosynthesis C-methylase UbiE/MenG (UbiE) (PDB:4OBW) [Commensalibacter papalotli (ex Botero et al. 2024)]
MTVPVLFNRKLVRYHRDRAARHSQAVRGIVEVCAERLLDRLDDIQRPFKDALEIGGRGVIAPVLQSRGMSVVSGDLSQRLVSLNKAPSVCMDEEFFPFKAQSFDLVVASFNLHWVNDLPGALIQIKNILRPDGLFLAAIPILPTLSMLRDIMAEEELELSDRVFPRVSPFPDLRVCATLMQRVGFALPVVDKEEVELVYRSAVGLMQDLRFSGETNALVEQKKTFSIRALIAHYFARLEEQGEFKMPLHFAILTGWAPDASQQQPLKPGQFSVSLEEMLTQ